MSNERISKNELINRIKEENITKCDKIQEEVGNYLLEECDCKFNKLEKCSRCEVNPEIGALPLFSSPFDASLMNTGHDGNGGNLSVGATDLYWEAGEGTIAGPGSVSTWVPATVVGQATSSWTTSPFNNAEWISFYPDAQHPDTSNRDYYFRYRFNLNSNIDPARFSLSMDFFADNAVAEIYVNNVPQGITPPVNPYNHTGFSNANPERIVLSNDWQSCENTVIVHVKSGSPLIGFLAQNTSICYDAELPDIFPDISISWGNSECDCMETDDVETLCITVCNNYCNLTFENFTINYLLVVDENGNPVETLPDGTPSVDVLPFGPICFGDIGPCEKQQGQTGEVIHVPTCKSREVVMINRGAKEGKYSLRLGAICFDIRYHVLTEDCFEFTLCKS